MKKGINRDAPCIIISPLIWPRRDNSRREKKEEKKIINRVKEMENKMTQQSSRHKNKNPSLVILLPSIRLRDETMVVMTMTTMIM